MSLGSMISVLFVALAATVAQPADERLAASREAGLARWARERAHNYLEDIADERRRGVVELQCRGIADEEEKWMCQKRGAYLAELMSVYKELRHDDVADMVTEFEARRGNPWIEKGIWVTVTNGTLDKFGIFGGAVPFKDVWMGVLGRVLEGIRFGAILPDQSFSFVVMFGDAGATVRGSPFSGEGPGVFPRFPVSTYSTSPTKAPYHFAMPYFEGLQIDDHVPKKPYLPFDELKNQAITRNMQGSWARLTLSVLTGIGYNPMLNVSMVVGNGPSGWLKWHSELCRGEIMSDLARFGKEHNYNNAALAKLTPANCAAMMYNGNFINWDEYVSYKYLLAPDMWMGAVNRLWALMYAPGVTITVQESTKQFQEYYFRDAVPFVHYVPLTDTKSELLANVTDTLSWLDRNQDITKAIAEESTRWVSKHKNHKTDMRQWKLWWALISDIYVPGTRPIPGVQQVKVECTQRPEDFYFYNDRGCMSEPQTACRNWVRKMWDLTCGPRSESGNILSESASPAPPTSLPKPTLPNTPRPVDPPISIHPPLLRNESQVATVSVAQLSFSRLHKKIIPQVNVPYLPIFAVGTIITLVIWKYGAALFAFSK
eukprot:Rhum_TRINITY_DN15147_c0_g1::Rhum_TRINITY_DN15147_c0_g1_i1::g.139149::m.139149